MVGIEGLFSSIEEKKNSFEIDTLKKEDVIAKYTFDFEEENIDEDTIDFLKEQTYKIHSLSKSFYTELGKIFKEAQDKLSNHGDGVFRKWIENIGFKKSNVYNYINRYIFISSLSNEQRKIAEGLPLKITYEVIKSVYTPEVKEKVLTGEINSFEKLKSYIPKKESIHKEVSPSLIYEEIKEILNLLGEKEERLRKCSDSITLHEIRKAKKIIKGL